MGIWMLIPVSSLVLAWPGRLPAEDAYTVRVREPAPGETCRVEKDETLDERVSYVDALGRGLGERNHAAGELSVYRETVLAREPGRPADRLRRTYEKARTREGGRDRPLVYEGRTVLIERKQGKYHFFLSGRGELTAAEAVLLRREFHGEHERFGLRNLIPAAPVRAGDYPWAVNMAPLVQDLGRTGKLIANPVAAKGTGRLQRVWRDDDNGRLFGEFAFQLEMPLTAARLGHDRIALRPGSKAISQMTLELCIDGSAFRLVQKSTTRVTATGPFVAADGTVGLVAITAQGDNKGSTREAPQK